MDVRFVTSTPDLAGRPLPVLPEFALLGRSNCGKSSLLNHLTGRRALFEIPALLGALHRRLAAMDEESFLRAAPSLRYAFSQLTPSELKRLGGAVARLARGSDDAPQHADADAEPKSPEVAAWSEADRREAWQLADAVDAMLDRYGLD